MDGWRQCIFLASPFFFTAAAAVAACTQLRYRSWELLIIIIPGYIRRGNGMMRQGGVGGGLVAKSLGAQMGFSLYYSFSLA